MDKKEILKDYNFLVVARSYYECIENREGTHAWIEVAIEDEYDKYLVGLAEEYGVDCQEIDGFENVGAILRLERSLILKLENLLLGLE